MKTKKILITGASQGIGRAIATHLAANENYQVIGTSRNVSSIINKIKNVTYINLDLGDAASVQACLKEVGDDVDILINNAGITQVGAVEELSMKKFKQIFEVNFFGSITLIQTISKSMRVRRTGLIINISSLADKIPVPYLSGYCATKAALTTFTLCLRMELAPYGIKVCAISPADINTGMRADVIFEKGSVYENNVLKINEAFNKNMASSPSPMLIAKQVQRILDTKNPQPIYNVGNKVGPIMFLKRILPDSAIEKIVRSMFGV